MASLHLRTKGRIWVLLLYIAVMATVGVLLQLFVGSAVHDWLYR